MGFADFLKGNGKRKGENASDVTPAHKSEKMSKSEKGEYDKRLELVIEFVGKKNYPKALELLESVFDKESEGDWYTKGNILANLEDPDGALGCYDKAVELDPRYVKAWYRRGWVLVSKKKAGDAIACFDKVVEIEGWLGEAISKARKTNDFNYISNAVAEKRNDNNGWSQAALVTRAYVMIVDSNARIMKKDKITAEESRRIKENIVYSYLVLRAYPDIAPRLPQMTTPDFMQIKMPDFILLNLNSVLDAVEPTVVVESRIRKK